MDADATWIGQGERERARLETLLSPWLVARIEHVGSTAIPDLPAKPILDLQAPVTDLGELRPDRRSTRAARLALRHPDLDQRSWRRFFVKVSDGRRSAHLHVMTPDSSALARADRVPRRAAFGLDVDRGLRRTQTWPRSQVRRRP